jgi:hypothetical protein
VLTPVTASNSGLASGCWARTLCQPLRKPPKRSPVTTARDNQDVNHRRFFPFAGGIAVVLGLGAFEQPAEPTASL